MLLFRLTGNLPYHDSREMSREERMKAREHFDWEQFDYGNDDKNG